MLQFHTLFFTQSNVCRSTHAAPQPSYLQLLFGTAIHRHRGPPCVDTCPSASGCHFQTKNVFTKLFDEHDIPRTSVKGARVGFSGRCCGKLGLSLGVRDDMR